jgi:DNA polymerase III subunit gamma/tau
MSQTLYRKYRPKNFSETIGQTHIVRTLSNSLKNNRVSHAYLFTGSRGTGKTSFARIFAKTINCTDLSYDEKKGSLAVPCEKCAACQSISSGKSLDIIEIDAASNTGVDNIRELRDTVSLASASLKFKVYIIDEVHMLSSGAFNALLKTLEEPPSHVVFILATTEIHKVPETIISRCQRFDFPRFPIQNIIEKLSLIAKIEKVSIEKEALEMIAISAEGGMRDAESLLGQIITLEDQKITVSEVEEILGTTDQKASEELARFVLEKKTTEAISKINELLENGYDLQTFNKSLVNYLRQLMLVKIDPELKKHFSFEMSAEKITRMEEIAKIADLSGIVSALNFFLEAQNKISSFVLSQLPLEIAIIKSTRTFPAEKIVKKETYVTEQAAGNPKNEKPGAEQKIEKKDTVQKEKPENDTSKKENLPTNDLNISDVKFNWKKMLVEIRPHNCSLSTLLCNCQPTKTEGNVLTIATSYDFYKEKLDEPKNKLTVEEVFSKILGSQLRLEIVIDKSLAPKDNDDCASEAGENSAKKQTPLLESALEIMGGKVVEE